MFDDFAEHYRTVILPARVRHPKDKALVENAVQLIYQRIYAPLRNRTFWSLDELNEAIWDLLKRHNDKPSQRLKISRRGFFEKIEKTSPQVPTSGAVCPQTVQGTYCPDQLPCRIA
jgi:hypothetical protein